MYRVTAYHCSKTDFPLYQKLTLKEYVRVCFRQCRAAPITVVVVLLKPQYKIYSHRQYSVLRNDTT